MTGILIIEAMAEANNLCHCFYVVIFQNFSKPVLRISSEIFPSKFPKNKTENSSDKYPENNIQQQWTNPQHSNHPSNHSGRTSICFRRRQDSHTAKVISPDSCTGTPCGESETLSTDSYSPTTDTGRNTPPQWNSTEVRRKRRYNRTSCSKSTPLP